MNTPIPFGRPQNFQFGGGQAGSGSPGSTSGLPPPTLLPDQGNLSPSERSYFHARGDSFASETSSSSHHKPGSSGSHKLVGPGHTSTSSVATSTFSLPSRKSSFASIRNAFKSGKSTAHDAPPVPHLDHQSYPVLRNPFSRTSSARSTAASVIGPATRRRPSAPSPSNVHAQSNSRSPPTSSAQNGIHMRGTSHAAPARHNYSHSDYSPASSLLHSDHGHGALTPPVPRVPNGIRNHKSTVSRSTDSEPSLEPRTPAEYALHRVFAQFLTSAEDKIRIFLNQSLVG